MTPATADPLTASAASDLLRASQGGHASAVTSRAQVAAGGYATAAPAVLPGSDQLLTEIPGAGQAACIDDEAALALCQPVLEAEAADDICHVTAQAASAGENPQEAKQQLNPSLSGASTVHGQSATFNGSQKGLTLAPQLPAASAAASQVGAAIQRSATAAVSGVASASAVSCSAATSNTSGDGAVTTQEHGKPRPVKPTQTAAEMLQWLDATLAAKKPSAVQAPAAGPTAMQRVHTPLIV